MVTQIRTPPTVVVPLRGEDRHRKQMTETVCQRLRGPHPLHADSPETAANQNRASDSPSLLVRDEAALRLGGIFTLPSCGPVVQEEIGEIGAPAGAVLPRVWFGRRSSDS